MGTDLGIHGIRQAQLLARLPESFKDIKEKYTEGALHLTAKELANIYYAYLCEVADEPDGGIVELFHQRGSKYGYLMMNAKDYFFSNFDWHNEESEDKYESKADFDQDMVFTKQQLLDLLDWFISLCYIYTAIKGEDTEFPEDFKPRYPVPARSLIDVFLEEADYLGDSLDLWYWFSYRFLTLRDTVKNAGYDYFFLSYSF
ncbi:hypothetical protein CLV59_105479 [Chitinophaga dinghuensis]|uniref:Uncharacterized protein n=1 Tax=Chitinophaga dinghuensis TaxID=1539050 RepID=A0A327VZ03_9BACT|nr:hypothetical protein [Chitinophaga dinghuensis]RAJ80370.1 hypothetical protein CLV59_105479 [Chitinophaga dinghuensis]